ncbi:MAG: RNA polymerase sigma factor [Proteiniphilum sp.]
MESLDALGIKFQKKRDDPSFSAIYNRLTDELYSYGISLGYRDETCKDAIQDIFYRLYLNRYRLQHVDNIIAYLFRSFRNRLTDLTKKEQRQETIDSHREAFALEVTILDNLIELEVSNSLRKKVESMLSHLTASQREVVYLRYMTGLHHRKIAEIMGIQEESARKLLYRALEKMRKIVAVEECTTLFLLIMLSL